MGIQIGVLAVRRSVLIHAPPARVWEEFTSFERLRSWFGVGHRLLAYEPKVGGNVKLEVDIEGSAMPFGGKVVVYEPGRELTFDNDWMPNQGWAAPTYVTLRLTPALDGTLVELFHHGFERTGGDVAAEHVGYEEGWGMWHLTGLKKIVEG